MHLQQAIFTSAQTVRGDGYQLVAASPGLSEADAQVLTLWCPSHGGLLSESPRAQSINFHRLPSGAYCLSRTRALGQEYSGRRGQRLHTHCLIVPAEGLARFNNNPFALLQAVIAGGVLERCETVQESSLPPLPLVGRASAFNGPLVQRVLAGLGIERFCGLIETILHQRPIGLVCQYSLEELLAAVVNCLPVECRTEFSFTTGLKYSAQRPFRLAAVADDLAEQNRLERQCGLTIVKVEQLAPHVPATRASWAAYLEKVFLQRGAMALAAALVRPRPGLNCAELPSLAAELAQELDRVKVSAPTPVGAKLVQAHAPHSTGAATSNSPGTELKRPAQILGSRTNMTMEQLEALDDAVYDTIAGRPGAFEALTTLWPRIMNQLEGDLVAQSREQYLRYAIAVWEEFLAQSRQPEKAMAALDVLCLLFDDEDF